MRTHGVEYLLIGGYAVALYGFPRFTGDIDVWVGKTPDNARRLIDAIRDFGFPLSDMTPESWIGVHKILRMGSPPFRIEIHNEISGVRFEDCYPRRQPGVLDGIEVSLIARADLIANKKAAGRHKDLADVEQIAENDAGST